MNLARKAGQIRHRLDPVSTAPSVLARRSRFFHATDAAHPTAVRKIDNARQATAMAFDEEEIPSFRLFFGGRIDRSARSNAFIHAAALAGQPVRV